MEAVVSTFLSILAINLTSDCNMSHEKLEGKWEGRSSTIPGYKAYKNLKPNFV